MRPRVSEVVLDASALMALLNSEPGAELVAGAIPEAAISAVYGAFLPAYDAPCG